MRIDVESSFHAGKAMELFLDGYNCAQSVFTAFCDLHGMEEKEALRLSSSFGGGMGRMREVCGALSGIFMAAGLLYGYDSPDDKDAKTEHYRRIQELAGAFKERTGTLLCRELLGLEGTGKDRSLLSVAPLQGAGWTGSGHTGCLSGGAFRQSISWQSIPEGYKPVWQPASSVPGLYGCRSIGRQ